MLEIQKYLKEGNSYKALAGAPYFLNIKEEGDLVMLKYNQIASDFTEPIVQECRGIIFYKKTWDIVSFPFVKFFNYGEPCAAELDETDLHIYQKIDGSLAKLWYFEGVWRLSSNGTIDASECVFENGINFSSLFMRALRTYGLDWETFVSTLDKDYTYMYELATPANKVVVQYDDYNLFYLGQRNNRTGIEEYCPDERISNVKVYNFKTFEEVIAAAAELPDNEEGYVVRDNNWNRVKIKNPTYFMLHKLANNGKPDIFQYVFDNNTDELLAYFPEYKNECEQVKNQLILLSKKATYYLEHFQRYYDLPRAEFAKCLLRGGAPAYYHSFIFKTYENHQLTWKDYTATWDIHKWRNIYERAKGDLV